MENNAVLDQVVPAPVAPAAVPAPVAPVTPVAPVPEKSLDQKLAESRSATKPLIDPGVDIGFDYKEIEAIVDPVAKDIAMKAYKSMQAGFTRKSQELAMTKKEAEAVISRSKNWSTQRIQDELLSNPEFLAAAQQISGASSNPQNSGLTNDEFSALTDSEKAQLSSLKNELNLLKQDKFSAIVAQTDSQLQAKYGQGYNPQIVNDGIAKLAQLQPHEIREYVYKALSRDEDVKAAYELGRSENGQLNQEKINSMSVVNGVNAAASDDRPIKQAGENDIAFMVRLGQYRLAQNKKK